MAANHPKGAGHSGGVHQWGRKLLLDTCSCPYNLCEIVSQPLGRLLSGPPNRTHITRTTNYFHETAAYQLTRETGHFRGTAVYQQRMQDQEIGLDVTDQQTD